MSVMRGNDQGGSDKIAVGQRRVERLALGRDSRDRRQGGRRLTGAPALLAVDLVCAKALR